MQRPIYLDNHSTTAVDPRVAEAMWPYFTQEYGNAGSVTHAYGGRAREALEAARGRLAAALGARPGELVFTSGATESNNLALRGIPPRRGGSSRHLVSVATEHHGVLDPLERLRRAGHEVTLLSVHPQGHPACGQIDVEQLEQALRPETDVVSVMLANNEIGVIQPLARIAEVCRRREVLLHCDATQAVGKMPVDVRELGVDLLSFSAHKLYGPKGIGVLYVRERSPRIRLTPQIDGGGQERGLRSGTVPVPLVVGLATALDLCLAELPGEAVRLGLLRDRLLARLQSRLPELRVNGPELESPDRPNPGRLPHNLNVCFPAVEGETLMLQTPEVAVSSGSACSASSPEPSHVLRGIGIPDEAIRRSLRFGLGRFTTEADVDAAADALAASVERLRGMLG